VDEAYENRLQRLAASGCDSDGTIADYRTIDRAWAKMSEAEAHRDSAAATEWEVAREEALAVLNARCPEGHSMRVSGPSISGWTIFVGKSALELPEDAWLGAVPGSAHPECWSFHDPPRACPERFYEIRRGDSWLTFHEDGERVYGVYLAPGEHDAFSFLDGVLDWQPRHGYPPDATVVGFLLISGEMKWSTEDDSG
jgi:hypothetical protein